MEVMGWGIESQPKGWPIHKDGAISGVGMYILRDGRTGRAVAPSVAPSARGAIARDGDDDNGKLRWHEPP